MIFFKKSFFKLLIFAQLFLLWSCGKVPPYERQNFPLPKDAEISDCDIGKHGGAFILTSAQDPKTFNELVVTDAETSSVMSLIFSNLTAYDPIKMEVIPLLAKSWEVSADSKTYTFRLREGVKFSDGTELSADDVIFTFDCIFAKQLDANGEEIRDKTGGKPLLRYPSRYAGQYTIGGEPVKYKKIDKYTVEFTTKNVYAPFLTDIGFISIMPKHKLQKAFDDGTFLQAWSTNTAINNPSEIVGAGPFMLHSYKPAERIVLVPNPHYWRADKEGKRLPYIDYLIVKIVSDRNTESILFATGQSDASEIDASDYSWIKNKQDTYNFKLYERGASPNIYFMWFNQNPNKNEENKPYVNPHKLKWFTDKKFRQAIMQAIDRDGLIGGVWFGRAVKIDSIISPANKKWYNPNVKKYSYKPKAALEILHSAGFKTAPDGTLHDAEKNPVEFDLLIADSSKNTSTTSSIVVENLKALGIKVNLISLDFSTLISRIDGTMDYDAAMLGFSGGGDPSGGKAIYRSDGTLHIWNPSQKVPETAWEKRIDELVDAQETTLDEEERIKLVGEMQEIFAEELPLIFLITPLSYSGIKEKWRNVKVPPLGSVLWNIDELYQDN